MRVAWPWGSLPGISTPASSLTTVPVRAGVTEVTANWATVQHLTKPHPRSPAASAQAVSLHCLNATSMATAISRFSKRTRRSLTGHSPSRLEMVILAPSSTTVRSRAGELDLTVDWGMEEPRPKPRLPSPAVLAITKLLSPFHHR